MNQLETQQSPYQSSSTPRYESLPAASPKHRYPRVLVVGAGGGTGRAVVSQALDLGYQVSALSRNPERLGIEHSNLRYIKCDAGDYASLAHAVCGHDAVLCAVGVSPFDRTHARTRTTENVVRAMEQHGVQRLVCLTVLGNYESRGNLNSYLKYLMIPLLLRQAFLDHRDQEDAIRASDLDWTIVRPPTLTNGPARGAYRHGFAGTEKNITLKISRADAAAFMLKQLETDDYMRSSPGISY